MKGALSERGGARAVRGTQRILMYRWRKNLSHSQPLRAGTARAPEFFGKR